MNVGETVTIDGMTAEVVEVRKTAPVAVVEFNTGERELHWYGDESTAPAEPETVRGPRIKTGGMADAWTDTHILGPINNGPSTDQLAELWGVPAQSNQSGASAPATEAPEQSPSRASHGHETPRQARRWQQVYGWYDRAGLCPRCSAQGAWGHQLGFSNVKSPCAPCSAIVAEFPTPVANGWHQLTERTADRYALIAVA